MLILLSLVTEVLKGKKKLEDLELEFDKFDYEFYKHITTQNVLYINHMEFATNEFNQCVQKTFYGYKINYSCVFAVLFKLSLKAYYDEVAKEREKFDEIAFYLQNIANKKEEEKIRAYFERVNDLQKRIQNIFSLAITTKTNDILLDMEEYITELENAILKIVINTNIEREV